MLQRSALLATLFTTLAAGCAVVPIPVQPARPVLVYSQQLPPPPPPPVFYYTPEPVVIYYPWLCYSCRWHRHH